MIKSWQHKGLRRFYETGSLAGICPNHSKRLKIILQRLDAATGPEDMNTPGMDFHGLKGNRAFCKTRGRIPKTAPSMTAPCEFLAFCR